MNNLEEFKSFVKKYPKLITHVKNGDMTWQKFYEFWSLYGEDETIWNKYIVEEKQEVKKTTPESQPSFNFKDVINMAKGVNLESAQKSITNIQKALGLIQDIVGNKNTPKTEDTYTPRPIYTHFED